MRTSDYRNRAAAEELKTHFADVGEYLASLDLHAAASLAQEADLDRLAQMAGKTNQFNATTIRGGTLTFKAL